MRLTFFLSAILVVPFAAPQKHNAEIFSRPNFDFIHYYSCLGKVDGLYVHPTDCTRFIVCSNGNAADMACADCDLNNVHQCAGSKYTVFDGTKTYCDWPSESTCHSQPDPSTTETAPTTTRAITTVAPVDHQTCNGKKAGDSCPETDCEKCGYCWEKRSFFLSCLRTFPTNPNDEVTGIIVHTPCDEGLWWNPDSKPESIAVGGACDEWTNLSEDVKNAYKSDTNCHKAVPICEYGQDVEAKCSVTYWFFDPAKMTDRDYLECSEGLLWDPSTETCRICEHVVYKDQSKCSC